MPSMVGWPRCSQPISAAATRRPSAGPCSRASSSTAAATSSTGHPAIWSPWRPGRRPPAARRRRRSPGRGRRGGSAACAPAGRRRGRGRSWPRSRTCASGGRRPAGLVRRRDLGDQRRRAGAGGVVGEVQPDRVGDLPGADRLGAHIGHPGAADRAARAALHHSTVRSAPVTGGTGGVHGAPNVASACAWPTIEHPPRRSAAMDGMPNRRRRIRRRAVALVATLVLAACSGDGDDTATTSTSVAPATVAGPAGRRRSPRPRPSARSHRTRRADARRHRGRSAAATSTAVDLTTGAATPLGRIGGQEVGVLGLAFAPGAAPTIVYGLTDAPNWSRSTPPIRPGAPRPCRSRGRRGLHAAGPRRRSGRRDAARAQRRGRAVRVDPATGVATAIGDGLGTPIADPGFGFDVDPATGLGAVEVRDR